MTPIERTSIGYEARSDSSAEDEDGLDAARGLRSALILEALAVGLVWLAYELAAWWRAR